MQQPQRGSRERNALRLGLFEPIVRREKTYATLAERWEASWETKRQTGRSWRRGRDRCHGTDARWRVWGESNPNGSS